MSMGFLVRLLKDPLSHFMVIGLAILGLTLVFTDETDPTVDPRRIVVDQQSLLEYLQYRSKAFEPETFQAALNAMSEPDLKALIDDYVRGEVLLREASALGLDQNDFVIERRLNQRMEFALRGLVADVSSINEEALAAYFERNKETYRISPSLTFTHIYFSSSSRDESEAQALALAALDDLRAGQGAAELGETFLYFDNYVERTPEFIRSHFGDEMTDIILTLEPAKGDWRGPYRSPFGYHLVQMMVRTPSRLPSLDEIKARVRQDAEREAVQANLDQAVAELTATYNVVIDLETMQ